MRIAKRVFWNPFLLILVVTAVAHSSGFYYTNPDTGTVGFMRYMDVRGQGWMYVDELLGAYATPAYVGPQGYNVVLKSGKTYFLPKENIVRVRGDAMVGARTNCHWTTQQVLRPDAEGQLRFEGKPVYRCR